MQPTCMLDLTKAINAIMFGQDTSADKIKSLCRATVECLPEVEVASVTFYSLADREAMVCGVYMEGMSPVDTNGILHMVDSSWSVLHPRLKESEYLTCTVPMDVMNDHDILMELHPRAQSFVTLPIECAGLGKGKGMMCVVLGSAAHTLTDPSSHVALCLLKALFMGSIGRTEFVRDMQQVFFILKARTMPELALQVISAVSMKLSTTPNCQHDCSVSLGLLPGEEQVLSVFRVVKDTLAMLDSPCTYTCQGVDSTATVQNVLVNKQGSLALHCLESNLEDAFFPDLTTLVMTTRNLDAKDVTDQSQGMHSCAVLLSLLTANGVPFCFFYLTGKANADFTAEVQVMKALKPSLTELMLAAICNEDFVTQAPSELQTRMLDSRSQSSNVYRLSMQSLERLRHNVARETNPCIFASYTSSHSSMPDVEHSSRSRNTLASNVSVVLNDQTSTNTSIAALVTHMQASIQVRLTSHWERTSGAEQLAQVAIYGEMGQGGYSRVYSGTWRGHQVAIKVTKLEDPTHHQTLAVAIATEVAVMSSMNHVNIVKLYDVISNVPLGVVLESIRSVSLYHRAVQAFEAGAGNRLASDEGVRCCVVIMELCPLGNLSRALRKGVFLHQKEDPTGQVVVSSNLPAILAALVDIASGISRLHTLGIIHCDLKPGNLMLVKESESQTGVCIKIGDFGLSKVLPTRTNNIMNTNIGGTIAWAAPECLVPDTLVGTAIDIYAFGMLMWQCITAKSPFQGVPSSEIAVAVVLERMRPEFPEDTPPAYVELAQRCWAHEASHRPNAASLLRKLQHLQQLAK